tara:strand:- start:626 stop:910 length:285 start_codon:yes stop_codon:yes gene_type:complete
MEQNQDNEKKVESDKKEENNDMESLFNTMMNSVKKPSLVVVIYLLLSNDVFKNLLTKMLPNKTIVVNNQDKILYISTAIIAGVLFFIFDKNVPI